MQICKMKRFEGILGSKLVRTVWNSGRRAYETGTTKQTSITFSDGFVVCHLISSCCEFLYVLCMLCMFKGGTVKVYWRTITVAHTKPFNGPISDTPEQLYSIRTKNVNGNDKPLNSTFEFNMKKVLDVSCKCSNWGFSNSSNGSYFKELC
jgi:hypothetical protein